MKCSINSCPVQICQCEIIQSTFRELSRQDLWVNVAILILVFIFISILYSVIIRHSSLFPSRASLVCHFSNFNRVLLCKSHVLMKAIFPFSFWLWNCEAVTNSWRRRGKRCCSLMLIGVSRDDQNDCQGKKAERALPLGRAGNDVVRVFDSV
jgi:hypothetical protein